MSRRPIDRLADAPLVHRLTPRPEPQTFRISRQIDRSEMRMMERGGMTKEQIVARIKRWLVGELAEHLADKCKVFEFDYNRLMRDPVVHIEITIDDRGTYEGMVDGAERAGRRQGIKEAIDAMPYGLNEVYE